MRLLLLLLLVVVVVLGVAAVDDKGGQHHGKDDQDKHKPPHACPGRLKCVAKKSCHARGFTPREPYTCGSRNYKGYVCCPQDRYKSDGSGYRSEYKPGYNRYNRKSYMDYYEDGYDKVYGNRLSKLAKEILSKYRYKDECGVRYQSPGDMARISSGYLAEKALTSFGEFPWHVALLVKEKQRHKRYGPRPLTAYRYHCGATLIHSILLLTAAHCVKGIKTHRLKARLGDWNLEDSTGELFPAIERHISRVFIHSGYKPATYLNDLALLQMNRPVDTTKTPHIAPACLPDDTFNFEDHKKGYIVGWGDDVYKPKFGSNILKATSVSYERDEECRDRLFQSLPNVADDYFLDTDVQKCVVGGYGRDACVGDGGGAVVIPLDNEAGPDACHDHNCADEHYYVAGILSFGSPVCGDNSVTIITDIIKNINWINTIINPAGGMKDYDINYYVDKPKYDYDYGSNYNSHDYYRPHSTSYDKYDRPYYYDMHGERPYYDFDGERPYSDRYDRRPSYDSYDTAPYYDGYDSSYDRYNKLPYYEEYDRRPYYGHDRPIYGKPPRYGEKYDDKPYYDIKYDDEPNDDKYDKPHHDKKYDDKPHHDKYKNKPSNYDDSDINYDSKHQLKLDKLYSKRSGETENVQSSGETENVEGNTNGTKGNTNGTKKSM